MRREGEGGRKRMDEITLNKRSSYVHHNKIINLSIFDSV
jgi:hypothetical protein